MDRGISIGRRRSTIAALGSDLRTDQTDLPTSRGEGRGIDIGCCNRHRPRSVFEDCAGGVFFLRKSSPSDGDDCSRYPSIVGRSFSSKVGCKTGRPWRRSEFDEFLLQAPIDHSNWEDLDEALEALGQFDIRLAKLVDLRFFGGMTLDEAADQLGLSRRTIASDWALARSWLRRRLEEK